MSPPRRPFARIAATAALMVAIGALSPIGGPGAEAQAAPEKLQRIAVVDVDRCILETVEGQRLTKELETTLDRRNREIERKTKDLQKQVQDVQAKASMLSDAELMKRQQELVAKNQELELLHAKYTEEVAQKEDLVAEKLLKNVRAVVKQIALEEDLQIVLVRSGGTVLYANPKLDITNRVIVAYDKKFK